MKRTTKLDNKDCLFAEALRNKGWTGEARVNTPKEIKQTTGIEYLVKGMIIALAIFHNSNCTYKVWLT